MSLPSFPEQNPPITREEVINQILLSIAMEEVGLSHIINAEGEKIQYAIGTISGVTGPTEPATIEDLLALNKSVRETLDSTVQNQMFLKSKMQCALSASVVHGPTGPTGPTGPFLSSYMEALGNGQIVGGGNNIVFDVDSIDSVGNNIELDSSGAIFTINHTGLYHVEWNINLAANSTGSVSAVVGILENGTPASGSACYQEGNFSSGTLIYVDTVPFTISLVNYNSEIILENPDLWVDSAASIRIVRFADGPSM